MKRRIKSFQYAIAGLTRVFAHEVNAKIHAFAAIMAIILGFLLHISMAEWLVIVLCIGMVLSLETINTAIEYLADFVSPQRHEQIKWVKDIAAGAVLLSAITAALIGMLIFFPKIYHLFLNQ